MLAYGQLAGFKKTKLSEKWPAEPRRILQQVLDRAGVKPVARTDVPVVETSLLAGPKASALVLVNYTYEPVASLSVELRSPVPIKKATSLEHGPITLQNTEAGVRLVLPLEWTDIVLLEQE